MARYTKIPRALWNDGQFAALSDHAKLAYFFVATHPAQTSVGAMRATIPGLASEIGWSARRCERFFQELIAAGLVEVNEQANFIGVADFFELNKPENPNVLRSWAGTFELLPDCRLKEQLVKRLATLAEGLGQAFAEAFEKAFLQDVAKGSPKQKQKQKQKQEQEEEDGCVIPFLVSETVDRRRDLKRYADEHGLEFEAEMNACRSWYEDKDRVPKSPYRAGLNWLKRSVDGQRRGLVGPAGLDESRRDKFDEIDSQAAAIAGGSS